MLDIAIYAVVGGALAGLLSAGLAGQPYKKLTFAVAGACGGALGLILYAIIRATMNLPVIFFWNGLAWSLAGVLFAVAILAASMSFKDN